MGKDASGRPVVFAVGEDGNVWLREQMGPGVNDWSPWTSLLKPAGVTLSAWGLWVAANVDGRVEVFVQGLDGKIYDAWQISPNFAGLYWWTPLDAPGGNTIIPFSGGRNADGRLAQRELSAQIVEAGAITFGR